MIYSCQYWLCSITLGSKPPHLHTEVSLKSLHQIWRETDPQELKMAIFYTPSCQTEMGDHIVHDNKGIPWCHYQKTSMVHVSVPTYLHTDLSMSAYIQNTYMHIYIQSCMYTYIHTYICIYIITNLHTYKHKYIYMHGSIAYISVT